jgi:hypothetical protein
MELLLPKEVVSNHQGTIEKIATKDSFLFVSSSDGHIVIYGKKDRAYYHTLKLHSKTVLDFDIHPSGKLLVSFGADGKLKLVDLASMSEVYHKNIKLAVDFIRFTPDDNLLFVSGRNLVLFNAEDNSEKVVKTFGSRITCVHREESLLIVGDDSGKIHFGNYGTFNFISFQAYENFRIKAFHYFKEDQLLVTMSTEGFVTVWLVDFLTSLLEQVDGDIELTEKVEPLYNFQIESRLICLDCKLERKKPKEKSKEEEAVAIKSVTTVKKGLIERIITKDKNLTRIGARGGRRGAKGLARLKKFNFLCRLGFHLQRKQKSAETEQN